MKTIMDIMNDVMGTELYDEDDVRACTLYNVKAIQVVECMRLYAQEAVQEFVCMETGEDGCMKVWQIYGIAGISTDQDKLDKFKETL